MDAGREDITYLHIIIHKQRTGYYIRTIQLFAYYTAADSISVHTDQKIEESCTVSYQQLLVGIDSAEYLLREIK